MSEFEKYLSPPISGGASTGGQPQCYRDDGCPNPAMCESRGRMCTPTQDHPVLHSEPSAPKVEHREHFPKAEREDTPEKIAALRKLMVEQAETASAPQVDVNKMARELNELVDRASEDYVLGDGEHLLTEEGERLAIEKAIADYLRSHLVGAPAQPGPEEKRCVAGFCGGWESHPIHHNKAFSNYHPFQEQKESKSKS